MSPVSIELSLGRHTMNIPSGMEELLRNVLEKGGVLEGNFFVMLGERISGSSHKQGISVLQFQEDSNSFSVKAQPGGNDTRHQCTIFFPAELRENSRELYEAVKAAAQNNSLESEDGVPPQAKKTKKRSATKMPENMLEKMPIVPRPRDIDEIINQERVAYLTEIDAEPLAFMLSEIYRKHGTSWISKHKMFQCFKGMHLNFKESILIRIIIKAGYLETNEETQPHNPHSRISEQGLHTLRNYVPSEPPERIEDLRKFDAILRLAKQHAEINDCIRKITEEILPLEERVQNLRRELDLLEDEIRLKNEAAMEMRSQITPQMIEAARINEMLQNIAL
jgi:hypothetical protein